VNSYWSFYADAATYSSFRESKRFCHKLAGVTPIRPGEERGSDGWLRAAEEAAWPVLYRWHYLRDRRGAAEDSEALTMREREDAEFVAALSQANHSAGVIDPGWIVTGRHGEECLCEKGGVRLRVRAALLQPESGRPREKEEVAIRFPAERRHWMPLYYCTAGGASCEPQLRVYFNVKPACAAWLLRYVSEGLREAGASYQFKLLNNPRRYTRPDAAVLYVPGEALDACRAIVMRVMASGTSAFRREAPALARPIHPGIAVADEPESARARRTSFGEHRCRIVARGLARAHAGGSRSTADAVEMICREFALENLDSSRPYANSGSQSVAARF
jgi:hypothetical protein